MTSDDIRTYLADNTEYNEDQIDILAELIYPRMDYTTIYDQIDRLVQVVTQYADWEQQGYKTLYETTPVIIHDNPV